METAQDMEEDRENKEIFSRQSENVDNSKAKDSVQLNLAKDSEELKSRIILMDSKLREVRVSQF